jgi:DnaJ-class molecular chaperone
MEDELDQAQSLIDSAMSDVHVVICQLCKGRGRHPEGLDVRCPRCKGRGEHIEENA